jgi:hypothetical protein
MLDMFLVHVMLILYLLQTRGVQNMLLDMLCEVMGVRHGRLQEKHVLEY